MSESRLNLHVDRDDCVWCSDAGAVAVNTGLSPDDFVSSGVEFSDFETVAVLGTRNNGALIHALFLARMFGRPYRVRIGSPAIVGKAAVLDDPVAVLQQLLQGQYPLAGQWHDLDRLDFCTYSMIDAIGNAHDVPETARKILLSHPAWPSLAFLNNLDLDFVCRLLCEIVDPRWYRHPFRTERDSRLYAYLGLTPKNIRAWLIGSEPDRHFDRAMTTVLAWYNPAVGVGPSPGDYLWRVFARHADVITGVLRTTQRFVTFLSRAWLMAVSSRHPEQVFDARFFSEPETAAAFQSHLDNWRLQAG